MDRMSSEIAIVRSEFGTSFNDLDFLIMLLELRADSVVHLYLFVTAYYMIYIINHKRTQLMKMLPRVQIARTNLRVSLTE